jgi:hypothetical protein
MRSPVWVRRSSAPPEFVEHERQFQTKRDRLGVNAVAAPDHRRHFESARLFGDCRS